MNEKIADVISRREFAFAPADDGSVFELVCSLGGNAASRRAVLSRAERLFGALCGGGVDAVFFEHYVFDISSDWADTQVYLPPRATLDEELRVCELMRELSRFPHRTVTDVAVDRSYYDKTFIRKNRCIAVVGGKTLDAVKHIKSDLFTAAPTVHFVSESNRCILSFDDDREARIAFFSEQKRDLFLAGFDAMLAPYGIAII